MPICNKIWISRHKISKGFHEYIGFVAKYYNFNEDKLKKSCKSKLNPEFALAFFNIVQKFTLTPPSIGTYVSFLTRKIIWLAFLLRFVDAVTDITLTSKYLSQNFWNDFLLQFPNKTICQADFITGCYFGQMNDNWVPGKFQMINVISSIDKSFISRAHFNFNSTIHICF